MRDTPAAAQLRYYELLGKLAPEQRLETALGLSRTVRELALTSIRNAHPDAGPDELRVRLTVRLYGRATAHTLFDDVPADAQ